MDEYLEKNYIEMRDKLFKENDKKCHVLKTIRGNKFQVIQYNNNIRVIPFTDKATPMTISIEEINKYKANEGNYGSYTPIILEYITKEKDFQNIPIENKKAKEIIIEAKVNGKEQITKNIILYGAPGVGKTHNYQNLIIKLENHRPEKEIFKAIESNKKTELNHPLFQDIKNEERIKFVTFHQSYSYEDFIEGFRPSENNGIKLEDGIFKSIVEDALDNEEQNYYIVIDEINRGNISKIFGELITLIEEDKRDKYDITLPYSKESFKVPSNLYIIATMNSTDKSIATIDIALRRRFTFLKMKPNLELVENQDAKNLMKKLNNHIEDKLGDDYKLGHSYFMNVKDESDLEFVKEYKIKPLLEEYFYSEDKSADEILKDIETIIEETDG